jgi:transposase
MAKPLLTDELWQRIEPLLPPPKPRRFRFPGRKPLTHRQALTGILFVLKTGINWNDLPRELNCGSGSRCRRRLVEWHEAGVWVRLHALLLDELQGADKIDWSRAAVDSSCARALGGGEETGPNPTDRGKKGTKHHAVVDAHGIPLAATATAANTPDVKELLEVMDQIPDVHGKPGRPRRRPEEAYGDRAYDSQPHREGCARGGPSRGWRGGTPNMVAGWGYSAGWWSGSSATCTGSASCGCGRTGRCRRMMPSSSWRVR